MANLAWHMTSPVYDAGDVVCSDTDLESAQSALGERVATLLTAKQLPLIIGGGHEVAWGTWQGISAVLPASARIGIINVDAHFDLRGGEQASSGTPFRQIANACAADGRLFRYSCLGVSAVSNTAALFETAKATGTVWMLDDDFSIWNRDGVERVVSQFVDSVDAIYLTLCLDAFPASIAPGVSAPAARGIEVAVVEALIDTLRESGLLIVAEVAELNPVFDQDSRTAKLAARLLVRCAGGGTISPA
jgi:formiminoglutamase